MIVPSFGNMDFSAQDASQWAWLLIWSVVIALLLWLLLARPRGIPPGPRGLPFVGNFFQLSRAPHKEYMKFGGKYGEIFSIYIGPKLVIVLNSYKVMKEAFVNMGNLFADRPRGNVLDPDLIGFFGEPYTDVHVREKKFGFSAMRLIGYATNAAEGHILASIDDLSQYLIKQESKPIDIVIPFQKATCKTVCGTLFSKQYVMEDPDLEDLVMRTRQVNNNFSDNAVLADSIPLWAAKLLFPQVLQESISIFSGLMNRHLKKIIQDHRASLDINHPRDILDYYLSVEGRSYSDQEMASRLTSFLVDATDTTGYLIIWNILFLSLYPKWQTELQQEIDEILGSSKALRVADRAHLPKVEAFLQETMRCSGLFNTSVPHKALHDTTLAGYLIPAHASVIGNFWATNMDPEAWPEPEKFKPERHLDTAGKFIKSDRVWIFGQGQRSCMGQQLAKNETFMFVTALLQRFTFELPDDQPRPRPEEANTGVLCPPPPFTVSCTPR